MQYYPISLNLAARSCAVLGGGLVAERKISLLAACGAKVTVISPALTANLTEMAAEGKITYIADKYRSGILTGFFLVICATADRVINALAAEEARQRGSLVNVVDEQALCDFLVPAHLARGDLTLTVSTAGRSPALAKAIKKQLAAAYGEEYAEYTALLAKLREKIKSQSFTSRERELIWQNAITKEVLELLQAGRLKDAEDMILNATSSDRPKP